MNYHGRSKLILLGAILILAAASDLTAQSLEELPGFREGAVVMRIVSRIVEEDQQVVWDSENIKLTISGRPVGLRLVGTNIVVAVQFTPFFRREGRHTLVAQGQIWINIPNEGISYHTTIQTIPLEFEEQIFFFPLGSNRDNDEPRIEIQLVMEPYSEETAIMLGRSRQNRNSP